MVEGKGVLCPNRRRGQWRVRAPSGLALAKPNLVRYPFMAVWDSNSRPSALSRTLQPRGNGFQLERPFMTADILVKLRLSDDM